MALVQVDVMRVTQERAEVDQQRYRSESEDGETLYARLAGVAPHEWAHPSWNRLCHQRKEALGIRSEFCTTQVNEYRVLLSGILWQNSAKGVSRIDNNVLAIDRGLQQQHMRLGILPAFCEQANALLMFAFEL